MHIYAGKVLKTHQQFLLFGIRGYNLSGGRLVINKSILFPNLFPYGRFSAVSLFDNAHYVEIGSAKPPTYMDSFKNSIQYLKQVMTIDPKAVYTAITINPYGRTVRLMVSLGRQIDSAGLDDLVISKKQENIC